MVVNLGFRSAPPQALRYRRAPRAKANRTNDELDRSSLKFVGVSGLCGSHASRKSRAVKIHRRAFLPNLHTFPQALCLHGAQHGSNISIHLDGFNCVSQGVRCTTTDARGDFDRCTRCFPGRDSTSLAARKATAQSWSRLRYGARDRTLDSSQVACVGRRLRQRLHRPSSLGDARIKCDWS